MPSNAVIIKFEDQYTTRSEEVTTETSILSLFPLIDLHHCLSLTSHVEYLIGRVGLGELEFSHDKLHVMYV